MKDTFSIKVSRNCATISLVAFSCSSTLAHFRCAVDNNEHIEPSFLGVELGHVKMIIVDRIVFEGLNFPICCSSFGSTEICCYSNTLRKLVLFKWGIQSWNTYKQSSNDNYVSH